MRFDPVVRSLAVVFLFTLGLGAGCATNGSGPAANAVVVERTTHRTWPGAIRLQNSKVEAIVVPEIGRVMSFRFRDGENVFWEDVSLAGRRGDASGKEWVNFGGDKSWPSPEAEWKNFTSYKTWMPPPGFDGLPASAQIEGDRIVLTSAVDPFYGIRAVRRIALQADAATMTIETTYERVSGAPAKIGIWVITQFIDPVAVHVPVAASSLFPRGHFTFRDTPWPQLTATNRVITVTRDPKANHKLGADADRMLWVGEHAMCLVSSPRVPGAEYPDRGASAEVYTNADPKKYVELETLGPLALLKPGDAIRHVNTYTLIRRANADPAADARRVLGL